jgi:hypothetical protein
MTGFNSASPALSRRTSGATHAVRPPAQSTSSLLTEEGGEEGLADMLILRGDNDFD